MSRKEVSNEEKENGLQHNSNKEDEAEGRTSVQDAQTGPFTLGNEEGTNTTTPFALFCL